MESNLLEFEYETITRPSLLNVLCILTFIGSTWAIVTNIWAYNMASQTAKILSHVREKNMPGSLREQDSVFYKDAGKKRSKFGENMVLSFTKLFNEETIRKNSLAGIISGIFTLGGAILMWRLRRIGFYLYIIGIMIGIVVPFYLYGNNLIAIGLSSFSSYFGLVFIALYALNIRALRK